MCPERQQLLVACAYGLLGVCVDVVLARSIGCALFPRWRMRARALKHWWKAHRSKQALFRFASVQSGHRRDIPVYRARNGRYVEPARFSERALTTIHSDVVAAPLRSTIVLHDVADPMSSFAGAFGSFAGDAILLHSSRRFETVIEPPSAESTLARRPASTKQLAIEFATDRGRIFKLGGE